MNLVDERDNTNALMSLHSETRKMLRQWKNQDSDAAKSFCRFVEEAIRDIELELVRREIYMF